ncbi:PRC-barrel domain-containing protein [Pelovirga terrestris]|uniref:PRC-barrel domain containing protein n=1 Tax=Pelovirga terrestris TaxID=2771352 RepID=A0A8J6R5S4_9BACT|nr:PRC-barrel domain-containing protein [Pelovirga terrestris]MBD1400584.1 PRC-barrel domain containing protein [Pelovirga terrestris]
MLKNAEHLIGYTLESCDGEIGQVKGFHCDDQHWTVRYLVADMGHWFRDRQILIPPSAITGVNLNMQTIDINLTKQQIDDIPALVHGETEARQLQDPRDPHRCSSHNLISSHVQGTDGDIGHIDDFLIDLDTWAIRYFIIDTRKWWLAKKVMLSSLWIERVNWLEAKVYVNLARETMKHTSPYTVLDPLNCRHESHRQRRREDWIKAMSHILGKSDNRELLKTQQNDHWLSGTTNQQ